MQLIELVQKARSVLGDHMFSNGGERNNDDVIEICDLIDEFFETTRKIIKFNALFSYQYYVGNTRIDTDELVELLAEKSGYEIIREGDGTYRTREVNLNGNDPNRG